MNEREVADFIKEKSHLFWWIREEDKKNISTNLLVESILNYGTEKDVKKLFDLLGIDNVSKIFYKQISGRRTNYHKRTINFFKLYFEKHV